MYSRASQIEIALVEVVVVKEDWLPDGLVDVIGRIFAVMEVGGTSNVDITGIPVS